MFSMLLKIYINLVIIILKLCTDTVDSIDITTDLKVICDTLYGTNFIKKPPPECTSLAIPNTNYGNLKAISAIKGNLSLFLVDDTKKYNEWSEFVKTDPKQYLFDLKKLGCNYIAFENTYKSQEDLNVDRPQFSQNLATFLDNAKKEYPDMGFGLAITHHLDWLNQSLDIRLLKNHVDFFLLNSGEYRNCFLRDDQSDMNVLATKDDINGSITGLKALGVDTSKLIYLIDLGVASLHKEWFLDYAEGEWMSYSRLCSVKMSKNRRYCYNTIQNLFEKARLHITEKTLGIYVHAIDDDDIDGKCGCTTKTDSSAAFRGLKTIAGASRENENDVSFYDCAQGKFPIILH